MIRPGGITAVTAGVGWLSHGGSWEKDAFGLASSLFQSHALLQYSTTVLTRYWHQDFGLLNLQKPDKLLFFVNTQAVLSVTSAENELRPPGVQSSQGALLGTHRLGGDKAT